MLLERTFYAVLKVFQRLDTIRSRFLLTVAESQFSRRYFVAVNKNVLPTIMFVQNVVSLHFLFSYIPKMEFLFISGFTPIMFTVFVAPKRPPNSQHDLSVNKLTFLKDFNRQNLWNSPPVPLFSSGIIRTTINIFFLFLTSTKLYVPLETERRPESGPAETLLNRIISGRNMLYYSQPKCRWLMKTFNTYPYNFCQAWVGDLLDNGTCSCLPYSYKNQFHRVQDLENTRPHLKRKKKENKARKEQAKIIWIIFRLLW